eukprot:UN14450
MSFLFFHYRCRSFQKKNYYYDLNHWNGRFHPQPTFASCFVVFWFIAFLGYWGNSH